jgi:sugar-specific transcriptional regulator TrmB
MALGLSDYEARAYIALASGPEPMTAYEIARQSQIPTSKIYEVAGRLIDRNIIQPVEETGVKKYVALDPEEFIAQSRSRFEQSIARAEKSLSSIKKNEGSASIWSIGSYDHLMEKCSRMIDESRKRILLSLSHEEMKDLHPLLVRAEKRKVKIAIVHFGEVNLSAGMTFAHPIADTIYAEKGGRGITIVSDEKAALMGTIQNNGSVEGGWSASKGFIALAEDYIKHDIYIMKIVSRYNDELIRRFGENYAMLRDIYSDKGVES